MLIGRVVIMDDDAEQVHSYFSVNEFDLIQICEKHEMNFEVVWGLVKDRAGDTHTFMFRLPLFNQHHPKEK